MKQTDLDSAEVSPETLQALADQIVNRQSGIQNFVLNNAIDFWLVRRIGLEPLSSTGRLVSAVFHFLTILVPALVLTAITRDGSGAALQALEERAPHVGVDWPLPVVDGFDHFTEVQLGLLKALADPVGEMISTLTGRMEGSKRRPVHPYLVS
jgi:hypothetical protein